MTEITLEEQKRIQLDILDDVARFCESHNINYFLAYGTLLGAIRHKGYIPWDDDIDIIMPRPDYDKFMNSFDKESGSKYNTLCEVRDEGYNCCFGKVHDKRTLFQEDYSRKSSFGVFIDVFPFDGYSSPSQMNYCNFLTNLLKIKLNVWYPGRSLLKNTITYIGKFLLLPLPIGVILKKMDKNARKLSFKDSKKVCSFFEKQPTFNKELFEDFTYAQFEDKKYRIPKDFDKVLSIEFGDYMKLPPEKDRVFKHHAKAWWK
jgi:lipopolysaccharide cholinephosphotransferase